MNPLIRDVVMRQSPRPRGFMMGEMNPAMAAMIDSEESVTRLNLVSKLYRNQTTTVAIRMTEKAFCRKSFAFSHMSWTVLRKEGSL